MYTGSENKYHVLKSRYQTLQDIALLMSTNYTECVGQMFKFNKTVAIDYYIAKSDPNTTGTLLMT